MRYMFKIFDVLNHQKHMLHACLASQCTNYAVSTPPMPLILLRLVKTVEPKNKIAYLYERK